MAWYIEEVTGNGQTLSTPISTAPLIIGRHSDCDLRIPTDETSRRHAEISLKNGILSIQDLASGNGTYVNSKRVDFRVALSHMDIIHIASKEFRIVRRDDSLHDSQKIASNPDEDNTILGQVALKKTAISYANLMSELLSTEKLAPTFEPIIDATSGDVAAYNAVLKGAHPQLPSSSEALFVIAENMNKAIELSEISRSIAALHFNSPIPRKLFLNLHPQETDVDRIVDQIKVLQRQSPNIEFVIELSEASVSELDFLRKLHTAFKINNISLAYEDFGIAQSRLLELLDVLPNYLKFNGSLVQDIHKQPKKSQYIVQSLVEMAKKLDVVTLAEGIQSQQSADVCAKLGFDLFQGSYFNQSK